MSAKLTLPACPKCDGEDVKPIVYGYPTQEVFEDPTIALGGCCIYDDSPAFLCAACDHAWGSRR